MKGTANIAETGETREEGPAPPKPASPSSVCRKAPEEPGRTLGDGGGGKYGGPGARRDPRAHLALKLALLL